MECIRRVLGASRCRSIRQKSWCFFVFCSLFVVLFLLSCFPLARQSISSHRFPSIEPYKEPHVYHGRRAGGSGVGLALVFFCCNAPVSARLRAVLVGHFRMELLSFQLSQPPAHPTGTRYFLDSYRI